MRRSEATALKGGSGMAVDLQITNLLAD